MIAIYASKLFKTSSRKDKIISTMNDPVNSELVTQLKSYLDEEYQTDEYLGGTPDKDIDSFDMPEASSDFGDSGDSGSGGPSGSSFSGGGGSFGSPSSFDTDFDSGSFEDTSDDGGMDADEFSDDEDVPGLVVEEESSSDVEESTRLKSRNKVYSSTLTSSELSVLQGTLNSREDTQGAIRANINEDELWIYYSDSTNLDNVMESIISVITLSYKNLKFNRLARTDNAIVFQIEKSPSMLMKVDE